MNGLSHKQARRYLLADLDGLLSDAQRLDLQTHLAGCDACRAEAGAFSTLTPRLQSEFHERWDAQDGPSLHVMTNVRSQTRRIIMSNKVNLGLKALGGVAVLVVLGFALNFVISQLRDHAVAANGTPDNIMPAPLPESRLLAFTKVEDGNFDIYTFHADGSNLTNLTNDPAYDANPFWSPDGKRIAFESDRTGFTQIFLMDADGSNVTQLTNDEADHNLPMNIDGKTNPWSPDGRKLLYLQTNSGEETSTLISQNISEENKTSLATGRISLSGISWSPDEKYIGYVQNDSPDRASSPPDSIFIVDADGSNPREIKELIPQNESLDIKYYWSSDGQSIIFTTNQNGSLRQAIYEFGPETNTLLQKAALNSRVLDWRDDVSLIMPSEKSDTTFIWQHRDGTDNTLDWGSSCWEFNFRRSPDGNFAIGAYCPDSKSGLYWANSDGSTIKRLLDPLGDDTTGGFWDIAWSPDDQYIAFNVQTSEKTDMYILNVEESLKEPSIQPVKVSLGGSDLYFTSSWQPVITEETLAERPPQPYEGLVAFTSAVENGNLDIYTMRPDGSGLTNLTDDPAHDVDPYWSPDGERIAFLSDRAGYMQIFTMNADGSDVLQVTRREADHAFQGLASSTFDPWSPDGSTLAFLERTPDGGQLIYTMEANGRNGLPLVYPPGNYTSISWSPDGSHLAYVVLSEDTEPQIHVIDTSGNNTVIITDALPAGEVLYSWKYSWTQNGRAISFVAHRHIDEGRDQWVAYEAGVNGDRLVEKATSSTPMHSWWDGTTFIQGFTGKTLTWLRADGTYSEFKPFRNCQMGSEPQYGFLAQRSASGSLLVSIDCPNKDLWFYRSNPDGTEIRQVLDAPLTAVNGGLNGIFWSPADRYAALNVSASGVTYMYVLDVENGSILAPVPISGGDLFYNISWQPMP